MSYRKAVGRGRLFTDRGWLRPQLAPTRLATTLHAPRLLLLIAVAAALTVMFSDRGDIAEAQIRDRILVSNMGEAKRSVGLVGGLSQAFTTGNNVDGYTITQIQIDSNEPDEAPFSMEVCTTDSTARPTESCTTLTPPGSFPRERLTFTAPGGLYLEPGTTYAVVLRRTTSQDVDVWGTTSGAEDSSSLTDWSLRDRYFYFDTPHDRWRPAGSQFIVRLSLAGTVNEPGDEFFSTLGQADARFTDEPDVAQSFTTGLNRGGYRLTTIDITMTTRNGETAVPTVTVHKDSPTGPTVATLVGPDALTANARDNYTFRAPPGTVLTPSTQHWLRIQSSTDVRLRNATGTPSTVSGSGFHGWSVGTVIDVSSSASNAIVNALQSRLLKFRVRGHANPPPTLIGNVGQAPSSTQEGGFDQGDYAQGFRTGRLGGSFFLSSVDLRLDVRPGQSFPTVTLRRGSASGAKVADFTPPSARASGLGDYTFRATAPVTLSASTGYWVVAEGSSAATWQTTSSAVAAGSLPDPRWTFLRWGESRKPNTATGGFTSFSGTERRFQLGLNALHTAPPYLVSNLGQPVTQVASFYTAGENYDLVKQFRTGAHPGGYTLTGVTFTMTLSRASSDVPTLELRSGSATGTRVATFNGPASLAARPEEYLFTPTAPVVLTASTTYWLVILDAIHEIGWRTADLNAQDPGGAGGWSIDTAIRFRPHGESETLVDSSHGLMLGISGTLRGVTNSAATGAPSITAPNVFRVPAVLTAHAPANLADANGIHGVEHTATYTWQRFSSDGTTLERDGIGHGPTYTLTDADAGKRLKVQFRFRDDAGYAEGLTSAATPVITGAAACAAPTLTGDFTLIGGARRITVAPVFSGYGFYATAPASNLEHPQFTSAAGHTYEITYVNNATAVFSVRFDKSIYEQDRPRLQLHACDDGPYSLRDIGSSQSYDNTGADKPGSWADQAVRDLYVSEDARAPEFVVASVEGTSLVITFHEPLGAAASLANSAFTVKKGSGGTIQTLTGSPSISGSTVTLTLATAVSDTETDVTVAYARPASGSANRIVDAYGNEADDFGDMETRNLLLDDVPPVVDSTTAPVLAADGKTLTITFAEPLKITSVPAASAFTVEATPLGGSEGTVAVATTNGVAVNGSTVVLTLATPVAHNDGSVKVSYEKPGSGAVLEDLKSNEATNFTDVAVTNNSTIPRVHIEALHSDASPRIAHAEFRVTRSNTSTSPLTVFLTFTQDDTYLASVNESIVIPANSSSATKKFPSEYTGNTSGDLTATVQSNDDLLAALSPNDSATVQMKVPASGDTLQSGNTLQSGYTLQVAHQQASYTVTEGNALDVTVTLNAPAGVAQVRDDVSFTVDYRQGTAVSGLDFDHFAHNLTVAPADWTESGGAFSATRTVTIQTLDKDQFYEASRQFSLDLGVLDYLAVCPPGTRVGQFCEVPVTINDDETLGITNVAVTSNPTGGSYYKAGETVSITATFNGSVTVTGTPQFAIDVGGQTRQAAYASGSASTALVFSYTFVGRDPEDHDGISWAANALALNGGTIKFTSTETAAQVEASRDHDAQGALSSHKVDPVKPTLTSASAEGTTMTLVFSETLNTSAPEIGQFNGKKTPNGGSETALTFTGASVSMNMVTLTLAPASSVAGTDTDVKLTYTNSGGSPLQDLAGNKADAFTGRSVDTDPPPAFGQNSYTFAVNEKATSGTVGTVTATDPANQAITYSVGGTDRTAFNRDFSLNSANGRITVKSSAAIDFEAKPSYSVTITATDSALAEATVYVTINVTNLDESGVVTVWEEPALGYPTTATVADPDGGVTQQSWSWARGDSAHGPFTAIAGATGDTYEPAPGDDGKFLRATVQYTDAHGPGKSASGTSSMVLTTPRIYQISFNILFDSDGYSATEDGGVATVRLYAHQKYHQNSSQNAPVQRRVTVPLTVSYGGGASAEDHEPIPTQVVFERGDRDRTFRVVATLDETRERGEWIDITMGALPAENRYFQGERTSTRVHLQDPDSPEYRLEPLTVSFDKASYSAREGSEAQVVLRLNRAFDDRQQLNIPVHHALASGDSAYTLRYQRAGRQFANYVSPMPFTFTQGQTEWTFTIRCDNDVVDREDWTVSLQLTEESLPAATSVGAIGQATVTCTDDDLPPDVSFRQSSFTASEGEDAVTVKVQLSRALGHEVTIPIGHAPKNGATEDDYSLGATSVTFAPGEMVKAFTARAIDDTVDDDGEFVLLSFGTLPSGVSKASTRQTSMLTLVDNDITPAIVHGAPRSSAVFFVDSSRSVAEGESVVVRLRRFYPDARIVVPVVISGRGPGAEGYTLTQDVTFEAGNNSSSFNFETIENALDDDGLWVELGFGTMPQHAHVRQDKATTRINVVDDDDPQITASFDSPTYTIAEVHYTNPGAREQSRTRVTVTLSASPEREVLIPIRLSPRDGASDDYTIQGGYGTNPYRVNSLEGDGEWRVILRFRPSDPLSQSFIVQAGDDNDDDDNEWVEVRFERLPENIRAGANARIDIVDDEDTPDPVDIVVILCSSTWNPGDIRPSILNLYASEDSGPVTFDVKLGSPVNHDVVVSLEVSRLGGATASDHSAIPGSLTFAAGETTKTIRVWATDDYEQDPGESLEITLGAMSDGFAASETFHTVVVNLVDNE